MLSDATYAEIARVTDQLLQEIEDWRVIDRATVVRAYVRLSAGTPIPPDYERKLMIAVQDLADLIEPYQNPELRAALDTLVATIDRERRRRRGKREGDVLI